MLLESFGFTPTESKVYLGLLRTGRATGYALARSVGLARANVYQALEALASRGAVQRLSGRPVRYAALEPSALAQQLEQQFNAELGTFLAEGAALRAKGREEETGAEIEDIARRSVLISRAVACAASADKELLAVVGPWARGLFFALEATHRRGIACRVLSLGTPAPVHATVRVVPERELVGYWGGLPVLLVADRTRTVCGTMSGETGATGVATAHPGVVPFLRHVLRRELASVAGARLSS